MLLCLAMNTNWNFFLLFVSNLEWKKEEYKHLFVVYQILENSGIQFQDEFQSSMAKRERIRKKGEGELH